MTNTNVINNANTNVYVYATVENRNVNDNSQMLMIGEELLCVRKAHDTMYIVNDATQAYVQAYVHQVVGNIACDTVVTQEGNDVHVTLKEVVSVDAQMLEDEYYIALECDEGDPINEDEMLLPWEDDAAVAEYKEWMREIAAKPEVPEVEGYVDIIDLLWDEVAYGLSTAELQAKLAEVGVRRTLEEVEFAVLDWLENMSNIAAGVNTDVDYLAYYEGGVDIEIDPEFGF